MKHLLVFLGVLGLSATGAFADIMTFDYATEGGHPPYSEAGMTVTTVDNYGWEPTFFNWGGLGLHMEGGIVRFDMGGSPFNLDELFYSTLDGESDNTVTFSNGGTHTFAGPGFADDVMVDLTGVSAAKGISWFTITLPDINYCSQLDYVAFTPVPLPASVILAYAGLATASLLKRRLRR